VPNGSWWVQPEVTETSSLDCATLVAPPWKAALPFQSLLPTCSHLALVFDCTRFVLTAP
jgi:hypothetical protein